MGQYRVFLPVANPETERDFLRMAAASAHEHDAENAEVIAVNVIEVPQQTSLTHTVEDDRIDFDRLGATLSDEDARASAETWEIELRHVHLPALEIRGCGRVRRPRRDDQILSLRTGSGRP
ncbi:hypothetical protein [Natronorubrum halophilum]|uniref:hypothetical protein n=1 Tax=Natronorubrum halophilum TaxID=1702106 RepID=UPI001EE7FADA|nr:hypothetical protein [Natronorubrum halophilum]